MAVDLNITGFQQQMIGKGENLPSGGLDGTLAGYMVKVDDSPLSLIADAAEELTFSLDNTDELDLKERREKQSPRARLLEKVEMYQEMMHQSGQGRRADPLIRFLKNQRDLQTLLDRAKEFFPDPADAWASLMEARQVLEGEGAVPEILAAIDQAVSQLENERGPEIRSGLEAVLGRAGFEHLGAPAELREEYRRTVCDFPDTVEMFEFIVEKYGEAGFDSAIDYLSKVLGNDLASDHPSHDGKHLEAVSGNLGQVRIINSAYALCGRLLTRWDQVHGVEQSRLTAMSLVKDILALKGESFIASSSIVRLVEEARPPDIEREVLFLQELLNTARSFSPQLFDGPENRLKFIDAIQQSLDLSIAREDEYLASLE